MPQFFASLGRRDRAAYDRFLWNQAILWPLLVSAWFVVNPAAARGQSPGDQLTDAIQLSELWSDDSLSAGAEFGLPNGGAGLEVTTFSDDDPLLHGGLIIDPNLIENNRFRVTPRKTERPKLWSRVVSDHRTFYNWRSFRLLGGGFLVGAAIANTRLDQDLQDHFQTSVRGATSDDWTEYLHANKELGNGRYTLPIFATAWAVGTVFDESPRLLTAGRWGERSLRTFLLGAPPLMLAQQLTGGSLTCRARRAVSTFIAEGETFHAFIGGADGTIKWIGHPSRIDEPLQQVVDGLM